MGLNSEGHLFSYYCETLSEHTAEILSAKGSARPSVQWQYLYSAANCQGRYIGGCIGGCILYTFLRFRYTVQETDKSNRFADKNVEGRKYSCAWFLIRLIHRGRSFCKFHTVGKISKDIISRQYFFFRQPLVWCNWIQ